MKRGVRYSLIALAVILVGGIVAPFIRVSYYREQIRESLQRNLHRRVDIYGDAHLNLFRGPGFSVEKVVIHDSVESGPEPLANVAELQTTVSLSSLWKGQLEFASVRFVEPSINLVKPDNAPWNVIGLLAGAAGGAPINSQRRLPVIQISNARLNFKFGYTKSAFYVTDADITVSPVSDGIEVRFSGAPARTDRTQQGYGLFSGKGRIANGRIDLDAQLERSPIEELITLVRGQPLGMHGAITSRAKITGPLTRPEVSGKLDIEDVHRWDQNSGRAGIWSLNYKGSFDVATQRFELVSAPRNGVTAGLVVDRVLSRPDWFAETTLEKLPAAGLLELARHMGAPLPAAGFAPEGEVSGKVRYGSSIGMQGSLTIERIQLKLGKGPQLSIPRAELEVHSDEVRLLPADVEGLGGTARLELAYAPFRQRLEAKLSGKALRLAALQQEGAAVPLSERFRGGTWSGSLTYLADNAQQTGDQPLGAWSARLQLRDTTTTVPGVAGQVRISTADVEMEGARLSVRRLRALAGPLEIFGEYRYLPDEEHPHQFALSLPAADTAELEKLFLPSLQHGSTNFLARTLRLRVAMPDWLQERKASGELRIGTLTAGEVTLRGVRSRVVWTGGNLQFPDFEARLDDATLTGKLTADLTKADPRYSATGRLKNFAWRNGHVDLNGTVSTNGLALETLANLKAGGKFDARAVSVPATLIASPAEMLRTASGTFDFYVSRNGAPQIRFSELQAALGAERFNGEGSTLADGSLQLDLASNTRKMRVSGPIAGLKIAIMEATPYGATGPALRHPDAR